MPGDRHCEFENANLREHDRDIFFGHFIIFARLIAVEQEVSRDDSRVLLRVLLLIDEPVKPRGLVEHGQHFAHRLQLESRGDDVDLFLNNRQFQQLCERLALDAVVEIRSQLGGFMKRLGRTCVIRVPDTTQRNVLPDGPVVAELFGGPRVELRGDLPAAHHGEPQGGLEILFRFLSRLNRLKLMRTAHRIRNLLSSVNLHQPLKERLSFLRVASQPQRQGEVFPCSHAV